MKRIRKLKRKLNIKYCECGCGQEVTKEGNRFIRGHNRFGEIHSEESKLKMSIVQQNMSEETKKKLSFIAKNRSDEIKRNFLLINIGRNHSEETKKKLSLVNIGKKLSKETKKKISLANIGKEVSNETRKKLSFLAKNRSEETREKISKGNKGKKYTEAAKLKMSLAALNRSEEAKLKASISRMKCRTDGYCDVWSDEDYKNDCRKDYCENVDCENNSRRLNLHHVDLDPMNCHPDNFLTLCASCHARLHTWLYNINNRKSASQENFMFLIEKNRIIYIHRETRKEIVIIKRNEFMKKEKYYYIRDEQNKPVITVCLIQNENNIARGFAICSKKDQPCKKVGRAIAKTRAVFALNSGKSNLEMNRKGLPLIAFNFGFPKSYFNPELTEHEERLFKPLSESA